VLAHLERRGVAKSAGSRVQFTIDVDDVDAMCAELVKRGMELMNGPMDRPWGIRTASFRDPGGQISEIAKEPIGWSASAAVGVARPTNSLWR
jgi:uncharacterized glyoxalase superfamily protein PhnB